MRPTTTAWRVITESSANSAQYASPATSEPTAKALPRAGSSTSRTSPATSMGSAAKTRTQPHATRSLLATMACREIGLASR